MRLAEPTPAKVMVMIDGKWSVQDAKAEIPAGWYIVPPRFVRPEDFE